jgi:hypothetical protein
MDLSTDSREALKTRPTPAAPLKLAPLAVRGTSGGGELASRHRSRVKRQLFSPPVYICPDVQAAKLTRSSYCVGHCGP